MKIIVEISDEALRNAVSSQVGAALAAMSREHIQAEAKTIISTAMQRIDWSGLAQREAQSMLRDKVDVVVSEVLGRQHYERRENVRKLIQDVAIEAIKGAK